MHADPLAGKPGLVHALAQVEGEVAAFFGGLSDAGFVHRVGDAWTPAEHLHHLNVSVSAVAKALGYPKLVPGLLFGRARQPSRTYAQVRHAYRAVLAGGGGASGRYVPPRVEAAPAEVPARRAELLARWARVNARLRAGVETWSDAQLDQLRLPHPLLGKLTVREMLFFTLYHNQHHIEAAQRRLPRLVPAR
ncbi:MAG TPA: DinB family protein [Longimicrobium sp.]|uniref:DinB family protein n=1 Tax=Longimicrobium sp. TaxID=2029185 RepID=UPI002ED89A32